MKLLQISVWVRFAAAKYDEAYRRRCPFCAGFWHTVTNIFIDEFNREADRQLAEIP